jgi:hypothetical protein
MNYYIIPKNNFNFELCLKLTNDAIKPYISFSLIFYLTAAYTQLLKLEDTSEKVLTDSITNDITNEKVLNEKVLNENITIDYVTQIVNPFEFIHTNVPGSILSVSKVKPDANIFFELMEIFQMFNINDILATKHKINIAHLTPNHTSTTYLLNMLREENNDFIIVEDFDYNKLYTKFITNKFVINNPVINNPVTNNNETKLDLIIFEFPKCDYANTTQYIHNMLLSLIIITKYQANLGTCIIKIDNIFYKAIIDIIFLLSSFYDKILLIKPIISNITKGERFIVCKSFNCHIVENSNIRNKIDEQILTKLNDSGTDDKGISSLINDEIPYYFLNKLEESNAVIGQQQLESYDQIINIFKNKNRDEKIENLKRQHIQKCIQWCEKNQLPHNKFIDKVNIFLTPKRKETECELSE